MKSKAFVYENKQGVISIGLPNPTDNGESFYIQFLDDKTQEILKKGIENINRGIQFDILNKLKLKKKKANYQIIKKNVKK